MGYRVIDNNFTVNIELYLFQFPLWDTSSGLHNYSNTVKFQFPLWDTWYEAYLCSEHKNFFKFQFPLWDTLKS